MAMQKSDKPAPAVALLFEDAAQSAYLRDALVALGVQIVHEGAATKLGPGVLVDAGADVVVVNLDDAVEAHLDALYDVLDESSHRVIFNDAEASRDLSGWDQARWARHLAAKLAGDLNVDPPRPEGARAVEPMAAAPSPPSVEPVAALDPTESGETVSALANEAAAADKQVLASELQALLNESANLLGESESSQASGSEGVTLAPIESDAGADGEFAFSEDDAAMFARFDALQGSTDDAPEEQLVDVDALFAVTAPREEEEETFSSDGELPSEADTVAEQVGPLDGTPAKVALSLIDFDTEDDDADVPAETGQVDRPAKPELAAPSWGLVDFTLETESEDSDTVDEAADPSEFGIEKMSAAEFLNPEDTGETMEPTEPRMTLELVSMEEALAPTMADVPAGEPLPDGFDGLRRLVVVSVDAGAVDVVSGFLKALPPLTSAALLLVVQPNEPVDADAWSARLGAGVPQRVQTAFQDMTLRPGDVAVTTTDSPIRVGREGRVRDEAEPGISAQMAALSKVFGPDLLVLLFGGRAAHMANALATVRGAGAGVWALEEPAQPTHAAVETARSNGLLDHAATAQELARRLASELGAA